MTLNSSPSGRPSLRKRRAKTKLAFSLMIILARRPAAFAGESRKTRCAFSRVTGRTDFCVLDGCGEARLDELEDCPCLVRMFQFRLCSDKFTIATTNLVPTYSPA